jgi:hypothetical protein
MYNKTTKVDMNTFQEIHDEFDNDNEYRFKKNHDKFMQHTTKR